jgi:hypothetical protein
MFEAVINGSIFYRLATFQLPRRGLGPQFVKPLLWPPANLLWK